MSLSIAHSETAVKVASTAPPFIARRAIDHEVAVGLVYDATKDVIIHGVKHNIPMQSTLSDKPPSCHPMRDLSNYTPNLMKKVDAEDDLSLFVGLQMIPAEGLGRLIHCSHAIDPYTRMISCTWISRTDHVPDYYLEYPKKISIPHTAGTHTIVLVNYGIDVAILLQLPRDDQLVGEIDNVLQDGCERFNQDQSSVWTDHEEILQNITSLRVLSNIPELQGTRSMIDLFQKMDQVKGDTSRHKPCSINLYPINLLYSVTGDEQIVYKEVSLALQADVEGYLLRIIRQFNAVKELMRQDYSCSRNLIRTFQENFAGERTALRQLYDREIRRLRRWLTSFRRGVVDETTNHQSTELIENVNGLHAKLIAKNKKERILHDLQRHEFEYRQAAVDEERQQTNDNNVRIVFGADHLHERQAEEWNRLKTQLLNERKEQPQLRLIYVDFTGHEYQLNEFRLLTISSSDEPVVDDEDSIVNAVLIGESGAGKSTFINALVNYLCFDNYEQADAGKPIVLLPISFLLTIGHYFEEREVKYDGLDTGSQEVHGQIGSSVTQTCRSYLFTIKDQEGRQRKLRLIDTPGSGDAEGVHRDERNRQDILLFIESLPRLHAVCVVMKPNVDRFTSSFEILLKELIDLLGAEAITDRLLFCFTNTRSTFYAPGRTTTALRQLFGSLALPFASKKSNTFCFDSESFRYLVAKQRGIVPDGDGAECCKETWNRSSLESKRLLSVLWNKFTSDERPSHQPSPVQARLKIHYLIRPMMETIRNILRHIILQEAKQSRIGIELQPVPITENVNVYHRCQRDLKQCGHFYMLTDSADTTHDDCSRESVLYYCLDYVKKESIACEPKQTLLSDLDFLCRQIAMFSSFLLDSSYNETPDPILSHWNQMISEEERLCQTQPSATLNVLLNAELQSLRTKHIELGEKSQKRVDTSVIDSLIHDVEAYPSIRKQLDAILVSKQHLVRQRQYRVPLFVRNN